MTTPRRSRISAARSTRSSSPSGRTMCLRCALARSISSYSNMIGVTRAGRSRAIRRSELARCRRQPRRGRAPSRSCARSRNACSGCTAWTAAAATCVSCSEPRSTGTGRLSSRRADGLAQRIAARQHDTGDGGDRRRDRRGERGDEDVRAGRRARSRARRRRDSSMKCSTLIAATLHVPHLALEASLRLLNRIAASSVAATSATVG